MREEMAEMDTYFRNGRKSPKIGLLPCCLIRIVWPRADLSGEVARPVNLVSWQQIAAQRVDVQPFVRLPFQAPIIKIEAVDIDPCPHGDSVRVLRSNRKGIIWRDTQSKFLEA